MQKLSLTFFLLCSLFSSAQKQGNIWYFGWYQGIDFNSGSPVVITGGQTYGSHPPEGSSVISDSSGSLLFYTNGQQVWNRNHQIMPNGDSLLGHWSSTQAAIIVPCPGSNRFFYVFTTDAFYINQLQYGFRYSIVDICLENGLGDVVSQQKNILLLDTVAEKLTALRHANGIDYWVITHKFFSDAFYAYRLTSIGITDTVISHIGSIHGGTIGSALGQLKASPGGNKLATANGNASPSIAEYFDFDKATGIVSNHVDLKPVLGARYQFYGVSFSPDDSKLYIASWLNSNGIYQFDLNRGGGNPDSVRASKYFINGTNTYGLQLGPDGKIYVTRAGWGTLPVINNPNLPGINCNFSLNGVHLLGSGMECPNFIDSYDYSNATDICQPTQAAFTGNSNLCPGTCTDFINLSFNATGYQWYFPGASPNSSTIANPTNICYNTTGSYDVQLIAINATSADTLIFTNYITVYPAPPSQSILQSGDTLISNIGFASYQWYFNGSLLILGTNHILIATASGDYNVVATDENGCEVEAAIFNVIANLPSLNSDSPWIEISPIPATEKLSITSSSFISQIKVFDLIGKDLFSQKYSDNKIELDVQSLTSGIYFLQIQTEKGLVIQKFIRE